MFGFFSYADHNHDSVVHWSVERERGENITDCYAKKCDKVIQPESKWDSLIKMSQLFLKFS